MKTVTLFLVLVFCYACSDIRRPEQLQKTEALLADLKTISEVSKNTDSLRILLLIKRIDSLEKRMKLDFKSDTMKFELVNELDKFKQIKPTLIFVANSKRRIDSLIEMRITTIENLHADIKESAGNRAKYDAYIQHESDEIEELKNFVNYCDSARAKSLKTFDTLHIGIEQFVSNLKIK